MPDTIKFYFLAHETKNALAQARIPMENIATPMLLVSSTADRMWPSSISAERVCLEMRASKGKCEHLRYDDASHVILEPWLPVAFGTYPAAPGRWDKASLGGTAEATARAAGDSWPRIRQFFDANLGW